MTPFELSVMIHYYAHVDDHEAFSRNGPIWVETKTRFLAEFLLELVPSGEVRESAFRITPRGRAFVEALGMVPLPSLQSRAPVWVMEWPTREEVS